MTRVETGSGPAAIPALERIDRWGETVLGRLQHRPSADVAAAALSNLSDYGLVWVVLAGLKARRAGAGRRRAVLALAAAGVASYSVNRAAKSLIGRRRPDRPEPSERRPHTIRVRTPASTSFPSGHTLAAFCTVVALTDGPAQAVAGLALAAAVAASRVHLGAHHMSDVVAGAAIGVATGLGVRAVLDRACLGSPVE